MDRILTPDGFIFAILLTVGCLAAGFWISVGWHLGRVAVHSTRDRGDA